MKNNKYQKEFSNYIQIMNESLKKGDLKVYEYAKEMLDETVGDYKRDKELMRELKTDNFGILNHIFEQELPRLIKSNKKGVRAVIRTIKEDKNLINEFNFYHVIKEQYKGTPDNIQSQTLLEKITKLVSKNIDLKTVKDSNNKLRKVMIENNIIPSDFVDDENRKLYESGHILLTKRVSANNMIPIVESHNRICEYMDKHKNDVVKEGKTPEELINDFETKLKDNLTESEISFVQQITDFRTPIAEKRKEKLFNKFKNECIDKINEMIKEDGENDELKQLSEQINSMSFNNESIVKDIAKLLEIRDILMDD